jgi:hypothetical protein
MLIDVTLKLRATKSHLTSSPAFLQSTFPSGPSTSYAHAMPGTTCPCRACFVNLELVPTSATVQYLW